MTGAEFLSEMPGDDSVSLAWHETEGVYVESDSEADFAAGRAHDRDSGHCHLDNAASAVRASGFVAIVGS